MIPRAFWESLILPLVVLVSFTSSFKTPAAEVRTEARGKDTLEVPFPLNEFDSFADKPDKGGAGCPTILGFLGAGESLPLEGCKEYFCQERAATSILLLRSCEIQESEIEESCEIVSRPDLEFPKCCEAVLVCKGIMTEVNFIGISKINGTDVANSSETVAASIQENSDIQEDNNVLSILKPSKERLIPPQDRKRRQMNLISESDVKTIEPRSCYTGNGFLKPNESLPLQGCARLQCIENKLGSLQLEVVSCGMQENFAVPEGCILNTDKKQELYPECCILEYYCEKKEVVPVAFTAANISQLSINETPNLIDSTDVSTVYGRTNKNLEDGDPISEAEERASPRPLPIRQERDVKPKEAFVFVADDEGDITPDSESSFIPEEGCMTENGILKVGQAVPYEGCAELACVPENDTFTLKLCSFNLSEDNLEEGCRIIPTPELAYPECCVIVKVCTEIVPVAYSTEKVTSLEPTESDNMIYTEKGSYRFHETEKLPKLQGFDQAVLQSDKGETKKKQSKDRSKRESDIDLTPNAEPTAAEALGCRIGNDVLKPGEVRPLPNCSQLKCITKGTEHSLVIVSCIPSTNSSREGCSLLPIQNDAFPDCCVREYTCGIVTEKIVPVVYTNGNISRLEQNDSENLIKLHARNENFRSADQVPSSSKTTESGIMTSNHNVSKSEHKNKSKYNSNKSMKPKDIKAKKKNDDFEYWKFIKRNNRKKRSSQSKPTFFFPIKKRLSSRKREVAVEKKNNDLDALELKSSMFVTAPPEETADEKTKNVEGKEKEGNTKPEIEKQANTRRRLSALLSSRNLRTSEVFIEDKKEDKKEIKINKAKNSLKENSGKEVKENSTESPTRTLRLQNRVNDKSINATNPARVAQRRRLYANRLNKFMATTNLEDNSEAKSTKIEDKNKKKNENKKKTEQTQDTKEIPKSKKEQVNKFALRRILNGRREKSLLDKEKKEEKENTEAEKLEEESKNLAVKTNSKEEQIKTQKNTKDVKISSLKMRYQQRRNSPAKTADISEKKDKKETSKKINHHKPSFELKSLRIKMDDSKSKEVKPSGKKDPEIQERNVSDSNKVNSVKITETPNAVTARGRLAVQSRNIRNRLRQHQKKNTTEALKAKTEEVNKKSEKDEPKTEVKSTKIETDKVRSDDTKKIKVELEKKKNEPTIESHNELIKLQELLKESIPSHTHPSSNNKEIPVVTIKTRDFESEYEGYSFIPKFNTNLDEFEKFYKYPLVNEDLSLSSSDNDQAEKSPKVRENEIPEVPDIPEAPMKITTVSFKTSRRSFQSSKTRNTSKNFKDTPDVYDTKEIFKSTNFR